jgi:4-hydroxybenzoate polyprenyltransferase
MHDSPRPASTVLAVVQAAHPGPALAVTLAAAALTQAADLSFGAAALVTAAVLSGQLSIGWSNDLIDVGRDTIAARADKPLASGRASVATVRAACAVAVVACLVLSLACGWAAGPVHLVCVAAGWAYNLRLKATVWSWLPYAVAFGSLPVFVGLARGGRHLPWWAAVAGALLGVGAHLVNVVPDLADDAATGVRGLPHRLGARGSSVLAVALLALASVMLVIAAHASLGAIGWAGLGVVVVLAAVALVGHGRTPFRAAMAIALVDVVILAVAL